jgi:hypothetical protein
VLRKICGPKRETVTEYWRRMHSEGPYDLYFSPNTIAVMKSRSGIGRTRGRLEGEVLTGFGGET